MAGAPRQTKLAVRDDRWMRGEAEHPGLSRGVVTLTFAAALTGFLFWAWDVDGRPAHEPAGYPCAERCLLLQL